MALRKLVLTLAVILAMAAPAWATTRYVAKAGDSGSDSNSCAASANIATPKLTLASALPCVQAGDTLLIRTGTYTEILDLITHTVAGTVGNRVWIGAYNGEVVTIAPGGSARWGLLIGTNDNITIDGLIFDCTSTATTSAACASTDGSPADNLILQNNEFKNGSHHGLLINGNNVQIVNNSIHTMGLHLPTSDFKGNGMYLQGITNSLVRGNTVYDNKCYGIRVFNSQASPSANNNIVERNYVHTNGDGKGLSGAAVCANSSDGGIVVGDQDNIVRYNVVYNNTNGIEVYKGANIADDNLIYHNTVYGNTTGIKVTLSSITDTIIKNNLVTGNTGTEISDAGTGTTTSYNACTAAELCGTTGKVTITAITSCTVSTTDFTQKAGSSCIDVGTVLAGYAYNGSGPDVGAFEMPAFASCSVEDGDASTLRVTFANNLNPPLLPSTGITGFTARKAGANDVITAAIRTGDNRVDLTLTDAIVNGNAVDVSYTAGTLTDSALIGNTLNQTYRTVLTNSSCTNNVGAAASHVFTQAAFEFHALRGTEAAPVGTPYATAPENTNIKVRVGGSVRLRLAVTCTTADCPPTGFYPRYSKNAGAYTVVPDVFAADNIGFCGTSPDPDIPASGTATTDQLSTAGAFVPGAFVRTSNAIPTVNLDNSPAEKTELEYCLAFDTDATAGDTYDIRLYEQDGTALGAYTVTPRMTLMSEQSGMGF